MAISMRRELVAIIMANTIAAIGSGLAGPIYYYYSQQFSLDYMNLTSIFGLFWVVVALLEIAFGHLSDSINKKILISLGGILASIATFSYNFASSLNVLYFIEILLAIATAMQFPALNSYLSELAKENERGKIFALVDSAHTLFYGLSIIISGLVITFLNLRILLFISSLLQASWTFVIMKNKTLF